MQKDLYNQNKEYHTHKLETIQKEHDHTYQLWEHAVKNLGLHGEGTNKKFVQIILIVGAFVSAFTIASLASTSAFPILLKLLPPLAAGFAGLLVVLMTLAVTYFYIHLVVEHRMKKNPEAPHYEFFTAGALFFLAAGFLLIGSIDPELFGEKFMLSWYLLLLLGISYIMGFYTRIYMLLNLKSKLEKKLENISTNLISVAYPEDGSLSLEEKKKFHAEYLNQLNMLYEILSKRGKYATESTDKDVHQKRHWWWGRLFIVRVIVKIGKYVRRRIRSYVWPVDDGDEVFYLYDKELLANSSFKIHHWERVWLPELVNDLEVLRKELATSELELIELQKKIELMESEETEVCKQLNFKISQLKNALSNYINRKKIIEQEYMHQKSLADQFRIKVLHAFNKGYNIGRWYFSDNGMKNQKAINLE